MTSEERTKIVKEYKKLLKLKAKYDALENERKELLKDPKVKRYLELLDLKDHEIGYDFYTSKTEDQLAILAYKGLTPEKDSNIYVYVGAYKTNPLDCDIVHGSRGCRVDDTNEKPEWYVFRSVDQYGEEKFVYPYDYDEFIKNNLILYTKPGKSYEVVDRYALLVVREGLVKARKIIAAEYGNK
ncbi:MAG: hypothetical protein MJ246_08420 [Clostridia bacterium]|nr:hypothetical protein [Clostridia bacterium]